MFTENCLLRGQKLSQCLQHPPPSPLPQHSWSSFRVNETFLPVDSLSLGAAVVGLDYAESLWSSGSHLREGDQE